MQVYRDSVERWIKIFGLHEWTISFDCEEIAGLAEVRTNYRSLIANFVLTNEYDEDFSPADLGRHEVIHLLLSPITSLACERFVSANEISQADERITVLIEKALEVNN